MEENFIQLKKRNTLKFGLRDENGVEKKDENGNLVYIEFDLEDVKLPSRIDKCYDLIKQAQQDLKWDFVIIDKHQDSNKKGKLLSRNEKDKVDAIEKYYKSMEEAYNLFLGENGIQKIFGNHRYYEMFNDLEEMLEPILPKLKVNFGDIIDSIKIKYKKTENDVLKNE